MKQNGAEDTLYCPTGCWERPCVAGEALTDTKCRLALGGACSAPWGLNNWVSAIARGAVAPGCSGGKRVSAFSFPPGGTVYRYCKGGRPFRATLRSMVGLVRRVNTLLKEYR